MKNASILNFFLIMPSLRLNIVEVDIFAGENHRAPYNTEINRTDQVPALVLDSGQAINEKPSPGSPNHIFNRHSARPWRHGICKGVSS